MNYVMKISYDGNLFYGFQRQKDKRTVQSEVEKVIKLIFKEKINLVYSSRTDRFVHAIEQYVSFNSNIEIELKKLYNAINNMLEEDIVLNEISFYPDDFHPRFCAKNKTYKYIITYDDCLFKRKYSYFSKEKLDIDLMNEAANQLIGKHDFFSFSNKNKDERNTFRTINFINLTYENNDVIIRINGNSFLYNMVRIIVMFLINVGLKKYSPLDVKTIFNTKDRAFTKKSAKANGLYLEKVNYDIKALSSYGQKE